MNAQAFVPVILESPYSGDVPLNLRYLRACMRDCLLRGESPFASHGAFTQPGVFRDEDLGDRELGICAGFAWRPLALRTVFYLDYGWSSGMKLGLEECKKIGHPYEERLLGELWLSRHIEREQSSAALVDWAPLRAA